ncbi:MAG: anthranilate phosphoribosyltransferase [Desulfobulbia bacterium]
MMKQAIAKVVAGTDLSEAEMVGVMETIMGGEATPAQIGAFITALRIKGETVDEITGAARVMRAKATKVDGVGEGGILVDTCGTGGDSSGTFNVSTTTAFVVAAAGVPVAKHGNRSVSSHCGSADVLEALGVDLTLSAEEIGQCIRDVGIGFMFAPALHGAMKHAIGPRREIGIRTIFNILGPLTNPAGANVQVMGVYAPSLTETLAQVLGRLGTKRALVVCGEGNLDEITITGATRVSDWANGTLTTYSIHPSELGMATATLAEIKGGTTAPEAAAQLRLVLSGAAGPCLDMVLLNAGAALMAAGRSDDLASGVALAREVVASGGALNKVDALIAFSKSVQK